nr:hypothetical protein CFP56_79108 [Quercus suber]
MSGSSTTATSQLQSSGMLSKEQLLHLFNRFTFLTSLPDVKNRIAEAVKDQQEPLSFQLMCILVLVKGQMGSQNWFHCDV